MGGGGVLLACSRPGSSACLPCCLKGLHFLKAGAKVLFSRGQRRRSNVGPHHLVTTSLLSRS